MPATVPLATYRLQFTPQFDFDQAAAIVPYLKKLGVSHLYASPFLKARAGTTHGYDIIDHSVLNPEFGGEAAFLRMSDALLTANMGLILDFVPNHMAVHGADNSWWLDVLEWGPRSSYAKFFDIDWQTATGPPRVLLPILGQSYGDVLEAGDIELRYDATEGSFSAWYYEHRLPIGPNRYSEILQRVVAAAGASELVAGKRLLEIAAHYRGPRNPSREQTPALKREIAAVADGANVIRRGLRTYQPKDGQAEATHSLHHLLERQYYRAAYWKLAQSDINYRRFFDINSLAGLRVEDPDVFSAIHPLVLRLVRDGRLQGLRIDHIDGLRDPHHYLRRLQRDTEAVKRRGSPLYVVVEKILGESESPPRFPGVAGTTGYECLNAITRVLVYGPGLETLNRVWSEVSGCRRGFEAILRDSKQYVLHTILSSEFSVLTRLLTRIAAGHYSTRDYTAGRLRDALELFVLNFPVYRTYVTAAGASPADRAIIETTIERCRAEWTGSDVIILDFLKDALTLDLIARERAKHSITRVRRFAFKVQQFTGPTMAKSLEDTACYRHHRLLALNEVGGSATNPPLLVNEFHQLMEKRSASFPHGLTATATHDTKRGEDARARIIALAELAGEWEEQVRRWREENRPLIEQLPNPAPTPAHQYMIYQALIGAFPLAGIEDDFVERVQNFAVKAAREGKEQTNWYVPNEAYEANLKLFIGSLLNSERAAPFINSFTRFAHRCALLGALNSMTQLVLKMTMPGVPDLYQGTEFWDLSFVDPDNRRPIDFDLRAHSLEGIGKRPNWSALIEDWRSGAIKHALTRELLTLRERLSKVYLMGSYHPLEVTGRHRDEIIAYARIQNQDAVIVVVGRFFARCTNAGRDWPRASAWDASLHVGRFQPWDDVLFGVHTHSPSNGEVSIGQLFHTLPIAILHAKSRTGIARMLQGH